MKHGRAPEHVAILPGVMPIIGESDQKAKEQLDLLQSWLTSTNALTLVSQRIGHDISGYPLDGPVPDFPQHTERGQAFSRALLDMARREKMTLRDLYNVTAAARGHWVIYGTPQADRRYLRGAGSPPGWRTASSSCRPISPEPSTISSITWCPSCSGAACSGGNTAGSTLRDHLGLARLSRAADRKTA